jgi:hypothetical protein
MLYEVFSYPEPTTDGQELVGTFYSSRPKNTTRLDVNIWSVHPESVQKPFQMQMWADYTTGNLLYINWDRQTCESQKMPAGTPFPPKDLLANATWIGTQTDAICRSVVDGWNVTMFQQGIQSNITVWVNEAGRPCRESFTRTVPIDDLKGEVQFLSARNTVPTGTFMDVPACPFPGSHTQAAGLQGAAVVTFAHLNKL